MNGRTKDRRGLTALLTGAGLQLFLGIIYVWSVFVAPVSEHFSWGIDRVKLTSSFMLCSFVLGILLGGKLQARAGTEKMVLAGGLIMAAGMLLTSFLPLSAPWLIYISYGAVGGLGVGMAYNAIITCAQRWFPQRRGLATGVSVCMFGFSTVIFAPLVEALVAQAGLNNTFRLLAAAFALVTLALFSFSRLPKEEAQASQAQASAAPAKRQYTTAEILKTREFYYIAVSMMLGISAYFILNPSFKTLAVERGLSAWMGTAIVMITGVANAIGRLVFPVLSDKIGREGGALAVLSLTALCALLLSFATGFVFVAAVAVIAMCYGGFSGVYPLVTGDTFGIKHVGSNYGAVMVGFALSALLMPLLMSLIGSELMRFLVLGALAALGGVLVLLLRLSNRKKEAAHG